MDGAGHYLGHDQTLALMRSEYHYPPLSDRASPADWEQAGARDEALAERDGQVERLRQNVVELKEQLAELNASLDVKDKESRSSASRS